MFCVRFLTLHLLKMTYPSGVSHLVESTEEHLLEPFRSKAHRDGTLKSGKSKRKRRWTCGCDLPGSSSVRRWDNIATDDPVRFNADMEERLQRCRFAKRLLHPHQYQAIAIFKMMCRARRPYARSGGSIGHTLSRCHGSINLKRPCF